MTVEPARGFPPVSSNMAMSNGENSEQHHEPMENGMVRYQERQTSGSVGSLFLAHFWIVDSPKHLLV